MSGTAGQGDWTVNCLDVTCAVDGTYVVNDGTQDFACGAGGEMVDGLQCPPASELCEQPSSSMDTCVNGEAVVQTFNGVDCDIDNLISEHVVV